MEFWKEYKKIILDTSILNHIFTVQIMEGEKILELLKSHQEQLWIPHTVYEEFSKFDQEEFIKRKQKEWKATKTNLKNETEAYRHKIEKIYSGTKNKGFYDWNIFLESYISELKNINTLNEQKIKSLSEENYMKKVENLVADVQELLKQLHDNKQVGKGFLLSEMLKIAEEGAKRYELLLPPGFSDNGKKGIGKYNDLFIWKEILEYIGESEGGKFVFITDDFKKDNWWEDGESGKRKPHKILMKEFKEICPDDYEFKRSFDLDFKSLEAFLEDNKEIIGTIPSSGQNKQIKDFLMNMYRTMIEDKLYSFVLDIEPVEIDDLYYLPNNDGDIMYDPSEVETYTVTMENEMMNCQMLISQQYDLSFANVDNEGDRFVFGDSRIQVYATVNISGKISEILGEDFLVLERNEYSIQIEQISYSVISNDSIFTH